MVYQTLGTSRAAVVIAHLAQTTSMASRPGARRAPPRSVSCSTTAAILSLSPYVRAPLRALKRTQIAGVALPAAFGASPWFGFVMLHIGYLAFYYAHWCDSAPPRTCVDLSDRWAGRSTTPASSSSAPSPTPLKVRTRRRRSPPIRLLTLCSAGADVGGAGVHCLRRLRLLGHPLQPLPPRRYALGAASRAASWHTAHTRACNYTGLSC